MCQGDNLRNTRMQVDLAGLPLSLPIIKLPIHLRLSMQKKAASDSYSFTVSSFFYNPRGDNHWRVIRRMNPRNAFVAHQDFREASLARNSRETRVSLFTKMTWHFQSARVMRDYDRDLRSLRREQHGDPRWGRRHAVSATDVIRNAPSDDSGRIGNGDSAAELLTDSS